MGDGMKPRSNARTLVWVAGVVLFMGVMAWASVPLYDLFCRVTGYGGTTQRASAGSGVVLDRKITVRFDASTGNNMAWKFAPVKTAMTLRIGETGLAYYRATNPTKRTITGTASFNVTPPTAGAYFSKIACFCFTEQTLKPGQTVLMPVTFYVDPAIVKDRDTDKVHTITLSYTFFETEPARAAGAGASERAARGG